MGFGLSEKTINILRDFFKKIPEIEEIRIYGSRAKGDFRKGSDIDFAVYGICPDIEIQLKSGLEALPIPYKFDVTDYSSITHESLKEHIDRVGKLFYKKELQ